MRHLEILATVLAVSLADGSASAQTTTARESSDVVRPLLALDFSYPLIVGVSAGAVYPPGETFAVPAPLGLRGEIEAGIGGGTVALGPEFRVAPYATVSAQIALLRTWGKPCGQPTNVTYRGGIIKYDLIGHGTMKLDLGYFRSEASPRDTTFLAFVGVGL